MPQSDSYDSLLSQSAPDQGAADMGTVTPQQNNSPGLGYDRLLNTTPGERKLSTTGQSREPESGWNNFWRELSNGFQHGELGISRAIEGNKNFVGLQDFSVAQNNVNKSALMRSVMDDEDYANMIGHGQIQQNPFARTVGGVVPGLGVTAGGVGAGALTALALGTPIGWGAVAGGALLGGSMALGHTMYDLQERGVDPSTSRVGAMFSGAINTALGFVGMGAGTKGAQLTADAILNNPTVKEAVFNQVAKFALAARINMSANEMSVLTDSAIKWAATKNSLGSKPYTTQEAMKDVQDGTISSLVNTGVTMGAFGLAGATSGLVTKRFNTAGEAVSAITSYFDRKSQDLENEARVNALKDIGVEVPTQEAQPKPATYSRPIQPGEVGAIDIAQKTAQAEQETANTKLLKEAQEKAQKAADTSYIESNVNKAALAARIMPGAGKALAEAEKTGKPVEPGKVELPSRPEQINKKALGFVNDALSNFGLGRTSYIHQSTQNGKLAKVFQDVPDGEKLVKTFSPDDAVNNFETFHRNLDDIAANNLSKATGLSRYELEWLSYNAMTAPEIKGEYLDANNTPQQFSLTPDKMLEALDLMKNEDALAAIRARPTKENPEWGNNMTIRRDMLPELEEKSAQAVFENALDLANPHYRQALEGGKAFYDEAGPRLQKFVKAVEGRDMELQENYGGYLRRLGVAEKNPESLVPVNPLEEQGGQGRANTEQQAPGFTKERGPSKVAVEFQGFFYKLNKRIRQQAQYEAMAGPSKLWQGLLDNQEFRYAVKQKFGQETLDSLENGYKDIVHGTARSQTAFSNLVDGIMRMQLIKKLGLKPIQALKHYMTIVNGALYRHEGEFIPPDEYLKGIADANANWAKVSKEVLSWPEVQNRYSLKNVGQIGAVTTSPTMNPAMNKAEQIAMLPFTVGDKPAVINIAHSVYRWVLNKTGDKALAQREGVRAFQETLAGGNRAVLSDMSKDNVGRMFAQFKQPEMRLAEHDNRAWTQFFNHQTPENFKAAIYTSVLTHFARFMFNVPSVLVAAAGTGLGIEALGNKDELANTAYRAVQSLLLGNMNPIVGDVIYQAMTKSINAVAQTHFYAPEIKPPFFDMFDKYGDTMADVIKYMAGNKEATLNNIMSTVLHAAQGLPAPIPETPIKAGKNVVKQVSQ